MRFEIVFMGKWSWNSEIGRRKMTVKNVIGASYVHRWISHNENRTLFLRGQKLYHVNKKMFFNTLFIKKN